MRFSKIKLARCRKCKWYKKSKWGEMEMHLCIYPRRLHPELSRYFRACRALPLICFKRERIKANENTKRNIIQ